MYKKDKKMKKTNGRNKYEYQYKADYLSDWDIHKNYIESFDAYEAMLIGQVYDSVSGSVDGSKITDSYATTLAKERADRVMAKLPEGRTISIGASDVGKAAFMDILREKWIYPNANSQHSFFEKLNMWQLYSSVYGYMPMFYDWNVSNSGYVGPDCWLWSPRNLIPQQGRSSIADMDYVTALTWVSKKFLKNIIKNNDKAEENMDGWDLDAVQVLLEMVETSSNPDFQKDSLISRERSPQNTKKGICLATRYEAGEDGEWVTFAPDQGCTEVRRLKNPHKNGRIPFVIKYSQPLFDSFYGLGDFQRAKPLQFARDGLTNFYFKGIKMNLIPPIIVNANGVMKHTIDYREGAVMMETLPNSIRRLETSTAGLATFQAAQSQLTGSLLSLYGTQNASIPGAEALNPSQGKTPGAINMYADKEATRDGSERRHLETAIEELTDGFFSLIVGIGTESIPVNLFYDEIKNIVDNGLEDVMGIFTGNFQPDASGSAGELRINPASLKGVEYRFNIDPNSTAKTNKDEQLRELENMIGLLGKYQNIFKDDQRIDIQWDKIMKTYENLSDIAGASEFVKVTDGPSPQELKQQQDQQAQQVQQQQQQQQMDMQQQQSDNSQGMEQAKLEQAMQMKQMDMEQAPQAPTVTKSGIFNDATIGAVAKQLESL
jgi:hypothetical protein